MIDSRNKRAAALGFGLSFLLVLPEADGSISIENAGHALNAYEFDLPALEIPGRVVGLIASTSTYTLRASVDSTTLRASTAQDEYAAGEGNG